jgi:ABC-type dipeptide/oligopeptide/nickel transport system permease component
MTSWFLRRLASSILLILVLVTAVFFVVRLAPGDPLDQVATEDLTDTERDLIRGRLGLDRPLTEQYLAWLTGVFRGDFGRSLSQHRPVGEVVGEALPATLLLTVTSYAFHLALALAAALVLVLQPGRPLARAVHGSGLVLYSMPSFWLGLMLILVFSRSLGWFPAGGMAGADAKYLAAGAIFVPLSPTS